MRIAGEVRCQFELTKITSDEHLRRTNKIHHAKKGDQDTENHDSGELNFAHLDVEETKIDCKWSSHAAISLSSIDLSSFLTTINKLHHLSYRFHDERKTSLHPMG